MALSATQYEGDVDVTMSGTSVVAHIVINQAYAATIDFVFFGKPYHFTVTKWSSRGLATFIRLFHATARDPAVYGVADYDEFGGLVDSGPTGAQKLAAVVQGCRDVLDCVSRILTTHGRGVLDYCVWYRETHKEEDMYPSFIAKIASHNIVHANFLAPAVHWDVVL
jgi:hypothetical protein